MHEFLSEDLAMACYSSGLLDSPTGPHTAKMAEIVERAGPILEGRDASDLSLITEVRLAAGDLAEKLRDDEIARLLPHFRSEYAKQKIPPAPPAKG